MNKYIFSASTAHDQIEVIALDEEDARHEAMTKRCGICPWYDKWTGKGLSLISVKK